MKATNILITVMAAAIAVTTVDAGATAAHEFSGRALAHNVIVPQSRVFHPDRRPGIQITGVTATVEILEQAATTTMEISVKNPGGSRQEAELIVPVPNGSVLRGFSYSGLPGEPVAQILPKDEARRIYDRIVSKMRDPGLLEFIGLNLVRSSVFPIEPGQTQIVRLVYENLLSAGGDRVDYVIPRTESLDYKVPWNITVTIASKRPISTVYSPTHEINTERIDQDSKRMKVSLTDSAKTQPGHFMLSYLLESNGMTASLFAYPDPKVGGGYFLLLAGLPAELPKHGDSPAIKREVTLVIDRSGSMNGGKLKQVREVAYQILAGLEDGEAFNIIVYHQSVDFFAISPVIKTEENIKKARAYLENVRAGGGTNIHDALVEALRQKSMPGMLPIVLFLTDGLPTVGTTSEVAIREVAVKGNPQNKRIFTFGVGVDVNAPLLDKIAAESRATSTYVLPKEDVEVKVADVFQRLSGPVLAEPELTLVDGDKTPDPGRVSDVIPARLPDMFEGDQLIVLGQYRGENPLNFVLGGNYLGTKRAFEFSFKLDDATTKNSFVPRLWASRQIGVLIDAIRQLGADGGSTSGRTDPKLKELIDEVIKLSTEFGILTEYTAFLAREGTEVADRDAVRRAAGRLFEHRAMGIRAGKAAVAQSENADFYSKQAVLNRANTYFDDKMDRVSISNVQQVNDLAFYRRGNRWIDSRIIDKERKMKPAKVIQFGSDEFYDYDLARKLLLQNRQGSMSLRGDVLMVVDGETILIKGFEK